MTIPNEIEAMCEYIIGVGPNEADPPVWQITLKATNGAVSSELVLPYPAALDLAQKMTKAAEYCRVQTIGEQNAEALAEPPALNAAKPRTCRICRKPIDDNVSNVPFLCAACYRELKS